MGLSTPYERARNSMQQQDASAHAIDQFRKEGSRAQIFKPRMNVFIAPDRLSTIALLELPGLTKSDIHVTLRDSLLIVHGSRRPPPATQCGQLVISELKFGKFLRVLALPTGTQAETIKASMDDGMLTISWPLLASASYPSSIHEQEQKKVSVA